MNLLSAFISGALAAVPFNYFQLDFLSWCGLLPLFFLTRNARWPQRFAIGYLYGVGLFSTAIYWMVHVSGLGAAALVMILAVFPAIFASYRIKDSAIDIFCVPALWTALELVRSHVFSGFPWALLAHSQANNKIAIQIADITGAYGVTYMIVLFNLCLFFVIAKYSNRKKASIIALIVMLSVYIYGFSSLRMPGAEGGIAVGIIQGNIPQDIKWNAESREFISETYKSLSLKASEELPDIIVWPETSATGLWREDMIGEDVKELALSTGVAFLVGAVREAPKKYYNSAFYVSPSGEIAGSYDKMHLVPFGEYVPLEKYFPWFRNMIDKPIGELDFGRTPSIFSVKTSKKLYGGDNIMRETRFFGFGVLICFEDIFPDIARTFVKNGADFLVNITNDAWFGDTSAPYQHAQSSVFRAIENRVPVIRAANTGLSCLINSKGVITNVVEKGGRETFVEGYCVAKIYPENRARTVYNIAGDAFAYLCVISVIFLLLVKRGDPAICRSSRR